MITKKIGIWGFGVSGQATAHFLRAQGYAVSIFDNKNLSDEIITNLKKNNIAWYCADQFDNFMSHHDLVIPSPGIAIAKHEQYRTKWLPELDFFFQHYTKPIIAITGSVGKTSTTTILAELLRQLGKNVQIGGNIGVGLCDLLNDQYEADHAVIEVSSFQLELCKQFAPTLAVWTNLYPNHLDRHETLLDYFKAKLPILLNQNEYQKALIPLELLLQKEYRSLLFKRKSALHFFAECKPSLEQLTCINNNSAVYYFDEKQFVMKYQNHIETVVSTSTFPTISFPNNWLVITAALDILNYRLPEKILFQESIEHRLEKVEYIHDIDVYNDSKATIMESTIAAVKQLQNRPILLILGGTSKGIDRSTYMSQLHNNNIKQIFCFGKEADRLQQYAHSHGFVATAYENLDQVIKAVFLQATKGDQILFSPGGASFDLFTDYKQRGNHFKQLIKNHR